MESKGNRRLRQYRRILKKAPILYKTAESVSRLSESDTAQNVTTWYVMAPIMYAFVSWVLHEALHNGRKRLYFLARDGYSMYQVATVICKEKRIPIDCRYLYSSRYAWRGAEYYLLGTSSLPHLCLGGIDVTFAKIMQRAGLTEAEAAEIGELLQYSDLDRVLSYREVKDLKPILKNCVPFWDKVLARAEKKYPIVCEYLIQEGLMEDIPYAIVDSGWTGSMHKSLQHLLQSMGYQGRLEGYYFGMYEYPDGISESAFHTWYFEPRGELNRKIYFSNSLFECIFSSPEGMVISYKKKGGCYEPVFERRWNPNRARIDASTECLKEYAMYAVRHLSGTEVAVRTDFRNIAAQLLYCFMGRPTQEEADAFGRYVFCDDVIGESTQTVAALLSYREFRQNDVFWKGLLFFLGRGCSAHGSAWPEGSAMRLPGHHMTNLVRCTVYKWVLYVKKRMKGRNRE